MDVRKKKINGTYVLTDRDKPIYIDEDLIVSIPSGLFDRTTKRTISYLHKAMKVMNQLSLLEDSIIIYRIIRAPEKRLFNVDVGNMTTAKVNAYLKKIIGK